MFSALPSTTDIMATYVSLVLIGRLVAFDHRSGSFGLKKAGIMRANEAHRSERRVPQRFKHPQRESLSVTGLRV